VSGPGGPLRATVVGVGAFGRHHARVYRELEHEGVRLVGLVDVDPHGPAEVAARLGVPLAARYEDLPEPVDVASVAVPTTSHRAVAVPLLESGVHCLVEKPVAGSTGEARALVEAAARGGAHLHVGLVERFNPVLAAADRLGEPPVYVEVHRLAPPSGRASDVGVVMDLMIHDLDIVLHLLGEEPASVEAVGVAPHGGHEDMANARITFPSGCVANVTASRVADRRLRCIRLFGRHGYLSLDYVEREAHLLREAQRGWEQDVRGLAAQGPHLDAWRTSGRRPPFEERLRPRRVPVTGGEPLRTEVAALVAAARGGSPPRAEGVEGLRALALAERILERIAVGHGRK
jgi:predicted dehydrogenase